jgi:XrtJ-associated TM-motif-TM protein
MTAVSVGLATDRVAFSDDTTKRFGHAKRQIIITRQPTCPSCLLGLCSNQESLVSPQTSLPSRLFPRCGSGNGQRKIESTSRKDKMKIVRISQDKPVRIALVAIAVLTAPLVAHAQSGCTDSPENPKVVLVLLGGVGALFSAIRAKRR